jgi:hypothetical protein
VDNLRGQTQQLAVWLCFAGSFLIFINVVALAFTGFPIMISPSQISVNSLNSTETWYRISFGVNYLIQGHIQILTWLFLAVLNFVLATSMVLTPEVPKGSIFVLALSLLLFLTGGGFIIGSVLAFMGSLYLIQRKQPTEEKFVTKILRALRIDPSLFREVKEKEESHHQAVFIIILVSFLIGLGTGIYSYNANKILNSSDYAIRILLLGNVYFDISILSSALISVSIGIIKWVALSFIIYLVGSRILGGNIEFKTISIPIAYAHVPLALQVFLPTVLSNEPMLTTNWPIIVLIITDFWFFLALIFAVKESLDVGTSKAVGIVLFTGSLYWLFVYKLLLPTLFMNTPPPGISINIQPNELVLIIVSASMLISYLLGTFKKYQ